MAGRCLLREDLRTFRLDRVANLELSDDTLDRPVNFDITTYLHKAMPFIQSTYAIEVWLQMPVREAHSYFARHRVAIEEENGGTTVRCGRDNLPVFAAMLLSLGCRITVRQPQELRDTFVMLSEQAFQAATTP